MAPPHPLDRLHAPAAERNKDAILAVLKRFLPSSGLVLEIASGTGQHASHGASALPGIRWQPSDPEPSLCASIASYAQEVPAGRCAQPLCFSAECDPWPVSSADAVVNINMIHIAPYTACEGLMRGAGKVLAEGAPLLLYGPFFTQSPIAPSNADFDATLRAQDPSWGVRQLRAVQETALAQGLRWVETVSMPAHNLMVVFKRAAAGASTSLCP